MYLYLSLGADLLDIFNKEHPLARPLLLILGLSALLIPTLLIYYQYRVTQYGRLHITPHSLSFQSHLPRFIQGFIPNHQLLCKDFNIEWSQVKRLQIKPAEAARYQPGPKFIQLIIQPRKQGKTPLPQIILFPYQWERPEQPVPAVSQLKKWGLFSKLPKEEDVTRQFFLSPMMKYIALNKLQAQQNFKIEVDDQLLVSSSLQRVFIFTVMGLLIVFAGVTLYRLMPIDGGKAIEAPPEVRAQYVLPTTQLHTLEGHTNNVLPVTFSLNGKWIASGSKDKSVLLWDAQRGERLNTLTGHTDKVQSLAFHPQGTWLAAAHWNSSLTLWKMPEGTLLYTLNEHTNSVNSVAFNAEGTLLASGGFDEVIHIWDVQDQRLQLRQTLKGHKDWVLGVSFSPDGRQLASTSFDKSIKIWDLDTGEALHTLYGHRDSIRDVAFHPDGTWLASCSFDNTIKFWEVKSGFLLDSVRAHDDYINHLAFSPDGQHIATASGDDSVRIWHHAPSKP